MQGGTTRISSMVRKALLLPSSFASWVKCLGCHENEGNRVSQIIHDVLLNGLDGVLALFLLKDFYMLFKAMQYVDTFFVVFLDFWGWSIVTNSQPKA